MGLWRASDSVNGPNLISWARVPLAALFPFVVDDPLHATVVLFVAGASDVVAGWRAARAAVPRWAR